MITREQARAYRAKIVTAAESLDDETALTVAELYPSLTGSGALIKAGSRYNIGGKLMRAAVDLWDRPENAPSAAPSLWDELNYSPSGAREIPETISAALAFSKGELGVWQGHTYRSLIDNNVWTPTAYPAGWELVE